MTPRFKQIVAAGSYAQDVRVFALGEDGKVYEWGSFGGSGRWEWQELSNSETPQPEGDRA